MKNKVNSVFISGASKGIGFELAKKYLNNNVKIFGIARNTEPLIKWAEENNKNELLSTHNIDLSKFNEMENLFEILDNYEFDLMINNAGIGVFGDFLNTPIDKEMMMVDLNIKSLQMMTKYFYKKYANSNTERRIINVSSVAAFEPGPLFAGYYASKGYVLSLSRAINYELEKMNSKLKVITLAPGALKTSFWDNAKYDGDSLPVHSMNLDKFISKSIKKIEKTKKDVILIGLYNKIMIYGQRFIPTRFVLNIVYKAQSKRK